MRSFLSHNLTQRHLLRYALISAVLLLDCYAVVLMYGQGEYLFALLTLVIVTSGVYIFSSTKAYTWRYLYPGIAAIIVFILFPLVATIAIAFTNYSSTHQLAFERAVKVLTAQKYLSGEKYDFKLYPASDNKFQIGLSHQGDYFLSEPVSLTESRVRLTAQNQPERQAAPLKTITQHRRLLQAITLILPNGSLLTMSSLRQFAVQSPRYHYDESNHQLINHENNKIYLANFDTGFFQQIDAQGNWLSEILEPGFTVSIGLANFMKIFTDAGIQKPFIQIFIWTMIFSVLTVIFTVILGMIFAGLVQWEALQGKAIYRLLLILPYAVPAFISILIFKGLFNQSFGEINMILHHLFGIRPEWFNDPFLAKVMILIVNTWLGYPYMMILCMGLLKAIPSDLYEASAIDGASTWHNFSKITVPLLLKPLTPLMIASFAFNFNNFVLIQLLTNGRPDMIGTTTPAGHTDLLVSYTYRIAFEAGGSQDFGLAAAIATLIFLLVAGLALLNINATKIKFD